jgi:hypothetical protein
MCQRSSQYEGHREAFGGYCSRVGLLRGLLLIWVNVSCDERGVVGVDLLMIIAEAVQIGVLLLDSEIGNWCHVVQCLRDVLDVPIKGMNVVLNVKVVRFGLFGALRCLAVGAQQNSRLLSSNACHSASQQGNSYPLPRKVFVSGAYFVLPRSILPPLRYGQPNWIARLGGLLWVALATGRCLSKECFSTFRIKILRGS